VLLERGIGESFGGCGGCGFERRKVNYFYFGTGVLARSVLRWTKAVDERRSGMGGEKNAAANTNTCAAGIDREHRAQRKGSGALCGSHRGGPPISTYFEPFSGRNLKIN